MNREAILIISFGSSHEETKKNTLDLIVQDIQAAYPAQRVYSAYTSKYIISKLDEVSQAKVMTISEAMLKMRLEGINKVYVQPTFVIEGVQYHEMVAQVKWYEEVFEWIEIGKPLLSSLEDYRAMIDLITKEHPVVHKDEAVICMGHGADDYLSVSFAALDYMFKEQAHEAYYVATLNAYPTLDIVMKALKKHHYKKIRIVPFMIVAGFHVVHDMMSKEQGSWTDLLEKAGYEVSYELRGLGAYQKVRERFIKHIKDMMI